MGKFLFIYVKGCIIKFKKNLRCEYFQILYQRSLVYLKHQENFYTAKIVNNILLMRCCIDCTVNFDMMDA